MNGVGLRNLRVEINGIELVNANYDEVLFSDGPGGVKIEGRVSRPSGGGGSPLLELLTGARRAPAQQQGYSGDTTDAQKADQPSEGSSDSD